MYVFECKSLTITQGERLELNVPYHITLLPVNPNKETTSPFYILDKNNKSSTSALINVSFTKPLWLGAGRDHVGTCSAIFA